MKLGLVTYNLAKDWDIPTIIGRCEATGFEAVELRTTHAHGVEPDISEERRGEVKKVFADSKVRLLSLGTTCEYHSDDPEVVKKNIEETKSFVKLAPDVGALGVKVRPNGFPDGVTKEKTLVQIGEALIECGNFAQDNGVEIWLEVHGRETQHPPNIHTIMQVADHANVGVCWNSNLTDLIEGSIKKNFNTLRPWLRNVHITELSNPDYPYRELFTYLEESGYDGYTLAEVQGNPQEEQFMHDYAALWKELQKEE